MAVDPLEVVLWPDPRLRRPTKPVAAVDDSVRAMAERMIATMHRAGGIGIAAPQVGWDRRVCIVSGTGDPGDEIVLVNPRIAGEEGTFEMEEGCLSFPGISAVITRAAKARVEYLDLDGRPRTLEAANLLGRCILHEVDHLDGVVFSSRFTPADRIRLKKALRALEERFASGVPSGGPR
ncbi:MAG: peptide deformylase [Planctomycetaceae bacterium]|nr:peptide deformylase [Planctomycetota bacterium]NUN52857.1 peptide deformylase [Planctomycetaceae bacterium]